MPQPTRAVEVDEDEDEDEEEGESLTPEEELEALAEEAASGVIGVRFLRAAPSGGRPLVLSYRPMISADQVLGVTELCRDAHGGGEGYIASFTRRGKFAYNYGFSLEGHPKPHPGSAPVAQAPAAPSFSPDAKSPREVELEARLAEIETVRREESLRSSILGEVRAALAGIAPAARPVDPVVAALQAKVDLLTAKPAVDPDVLELRAELKRVKADQEKQVKEAEEARAKAEKQLEANKLEALRAEFMGSQAAVLERLEALRKKGKKKKSDETPSAWERVTDLMRKSELHELAVKKQKESPKNPFWDRLVNELTASAEDPALGLAKKVGEKIGEIAESVSAKASGGGNKDPEFYSWVTDTLKNPSKAADIEYVAQGVARHGNKLGILCSITDKAALVAFASSNFGPAFGAEAQKWDDETVKNVLLVVQILLETLKKIAGPEAPAQGAPAPAASPPAPAPAPPPGPRAANAPLPLPLPVPKCASHDSPMTLGEDGYFCPACEAVEDGVDEGEEEADGEQ